MIKLAISGSRGKMGSLFRRISRNNLSDAAELVRRLGVPKYD
jgi:hypothetical protein